MFHQNTTGEVKVFGLQIEKKSQKRNRMISCIVTRKGLGNILDVSCHIFGGNSSSEIRVNSDVMLFLLHHVKPI
jgi:hypothetical protein